MANFLPAETVAEIIAGVQAGLSLRAISRMTGTSKNTVSKYIPRQRPPCPCGAPAGHNGWCKARYAESPARKAFHALRRGVVLPVPQVEKRSRVKEARAIFEFVFGLCEDWKERALLLPEDEHYGVIGEVHAATRRVAIDYRDDVRQSMILAVYEGRVQRDQVGDLVGAFVKYEMKNIIGSIWSVYISLDTPLSSESGPHTFLSLLSGESSLDRDGVWRPSEQAA
jgi:hypothetical protein